MASRYPCPHAAMTPRSHVITIHGAGTPMRARGRGAARKERVPRSLARAWPHVTVSAWLRSLTPPQERVRLRPWRHVFVLTEFRADVMSCRQGTVLTR
jgi:hypothetical protein